MGYHRGISNFKMGYHRGISNFKMGYHRGIVNFKMGYHRGISNFKMGYQPIANIVKDEKGDLVAESHSILARWRNHFCQLLSVDGVNNARQTEIRTAAPLASEPSAFEFELSIEKLKRQITKY